MQTDELKKHRRTQTTAQGETRPHAEPETNQRNRSSSPLNGLSFAQTVEGDAKGSMKAVGQICKATMIGVSLCGLGALGILFSLLLL